LLISIVIPTYNEDSIHENLLRLVQQTVFDKYLQDTEIVLADYDPERKQKTRNGLDIFLAQLKKNYYNIKLVPVPKKGIGYARHIGITNSSGQIIVNIDADSFYYNRTGVESSIKPILSGEYVMTCCDNILNTSEITDPKLNKNENILIVKVGYAVSNTIQRDWPIVTLEPGFCFSRKAYEYSGGFADIKQSEGGLLSTRIVYNFGFNCKKHVPDTAVIVSARRAIASAKYGIIDTWFNYDNAFRLNKGSIDSFNL
jgi:glycosyltransferase involved in cell wall biosynthesis